MTPPSRANAETGLLSPGRFRTRSGPTLTGMFSIRGGRACLSTLSVMVLLAAAALLGPAGRCWSWGVLGLIHEDLLLSGGVCSPAAGPMVSAA